MKNIFLLLFIFLLLGCSLRDKEPDVDQINKEIKVFPSASGEIYFGNEIIHLSGEKEFVWKFECNHGQCAYGRFINGEYWVSPIYKGDGVTIVSVEPTGERHGLQINPAKNFKQGLLSCQKGTYQQSLNLMNELPVTVYKIASLLKTYASDGDCKSKKLKGCCADSYDVLTVLEKLPESGGGAYFRPGFAGEQKRFLSINDFNFELLPQINLINQTGMQSNYAEIVQRWSTPFFDHVIPSAGSQNSAFVPKKVLPDFSMAFGSLYLQDMMSVFGEDMSEEKNQAVYALLQRGIDLFASFEQGVDWNIGGGSGFGRKPALAFLASLTENQDIKETVADMAVNYEQSTSEDRQISVLPESLGGSNLPVWGEKCAENTYWSQLFFHQQYDGSSGKKIGSGDNKRICRDPYGRIDGPAGLPGSTGYMRNGIFVSFALAQKMMPELLEANNDTELMDYTNRVLTKGIEISEDNCAPPDINESKSCKPYKKGAPGCLFYGVTWGPDPIDDGQCIKDIANKADAGRFANLVVEPINDFIYEPKLSIAIRELIDQFKADKARNISEEKGEPSVDRKSELVKQLSFGSTSNIVKSSVSKKNQRPVSVEPKSGTGSKQVVIEHVSGGKAFKWVFDCDQGGCTSGQFINGEYWIAPAKNSVNITLVNVSPEGEENGLESNPVQNAKQGLLSCQTKSYSSTLNLMNKLPMKVVVNTSLIKADKREKQCGTKSISGCCIDAYDVVTVLDKEPDQKGALSFRPGFAGNNKTIFEKNDFDWSVIPAESRVSRSKKKLGYEDIAKTWSTPFFDHMMSVVGDKGRAFTPAAVLEDYGAAHAAKYLESLISVFSNDSIEKKGSAVYALVQRGIDLYSSWESGVRWPDGAGQQMGRKPPLAFFAALVNNSQIKNKIMKMANNNGYDTQEDGQIRKISVAKGGGGFEIWGSNKEKFCSEGFYWQQLFQEQKYAGATGIKIGSGDNKRTCGDPYGFIDGPAGLPGTSYMACCSTGGFNAFVLAQLMMPELKKANNDPELINFVYRVKEQGIHTLPDDCAPPDPEESKECKAYKPNSPGCLYYGKTWGPNPKRKGQCIKNSKDQNGRFPHIHGKPLTGVRYEPNISKELWDFYK